MTYQNSVCTDAGTAHCPCALAETGDCLVCSRLAGRDECGCSWAGVCVYNEYIQNDRVVRNRRESRTVPIVKKIRYGGDLLVMVLKVSKGFALRAMEPGSFVFINRTGENDFFNMPVSVMKADVENERLYIALKVISGKTKKAAEAAESLQLRGVYRNGLLGEGTAGLAEDRKNGGRWLVITKGIGFAPAVNLLEWAGGRVSVDMIADLEKVSEEMFEDNMRECMAETGDNLHLKKISLQEIMPSLSEEKAAFYDRIILLASDYYIRTVTEKMAIPSHKLVFCNNFRMCCGEGICGACSHVDSTGKVSKMCKCRGDYEMVSTL
ncbi:MAG: hypothetical protein ACI4LD_00710 [Lentihominibacter sp.]